MNKEKKILFFSPVYPTGGIATCTLNILEYVKNKKISSFYFCDGSIYHKKAGQSSIIRCVYSGVVDSVMLIRNYISAIRKVHPNVIHINTSASFALLKDFLYLKIANIFHADVVFHYHFGRIPELEKKKNWEWRLLLKNINNSRRAIVIDPLSKETLDRNGLSGKVSYIPNPCSTKLVKIAESEVFEKNINSFIFVGHVIPTKGVYELVKAFTEIEKPLNLTIIGLVNEKIKDELKQISKQKENGKWLSIVGNKDLNFVYEQMKHAAALVLPSYTEGFPNVVLEAMACGCPVIATNVGAIPDMLSINSVNKSCGICIGPCSVEKLREGLKSFINSPQKQIEYAENGKRKILAEYTIDKVFSQYENVWFD